MQYKWLHFHTWEEKNIHILSEIHVRNIDNSQQGLAKHTEKLIIFCKEVRFSIFTETKRFMRVASSQQHNLQKHMHPISKDSNGQENIIKSNNYNEVRLQSWDPNDYNDKWRERFWLNVTGVKHWRPWLPFDYRGGKWKSFDKISSFAQDSIFHSVSNTGYCCNGPQDPMVYNGEHRLHQKIHNHLHESNKDFLNNVIHNKVHSFCGHNDRYVGCLVKHTRLIVQVGIMITWPVRNIQV